MTAEIVVSYPDQTDDEFPIDLSRATAISITVRGDLEWRMTVEPSASGVMLVGPALGREVIGVFRQHDAWPGDRDMWCKFCDGKVLLATTRPVSFIHAEEAS